MEIDYNKKFEEHYKRLNKKQKEAVDAIDGPVMVIAGPGTGKTSILTLRIANILRRTDTRPENILALTFTTSGVNSIRRKLIDIMGGIAYKINIFTFHEFANFIIKKYPDDFPRIISSDNASEVDKIEIVEKIIDESSFELIKPYGDNHYYVQSIISAIKHLKRESISVDDFKELIKTEEKEYKNIDDLIYETGVHKGKIKGKYKDIEKNIKKNKELVIVYHLYEKELTRRKRYDFEDMLLELIGALRTNQDLLFSLQEEYQYIMADEHQDANNSQNTILELLANFHENPNIFIVGDEKQAIFRFQGASLENFLYFKDLYKNVRLVSLEDNYRSTQTILDASHELILHNETKEEMKVRLISQKKHKEGPISVLEFVNEIDELGHIISEVKSLIAEGVSPKDIAVLFRKNKEADALVNAFSHAGIHFSLYSDQDMLKDHDVRKLLLILSAINDPSDDELISEISFFSVFDLPVDSLYQAFDVIRKKRVSAMISYKEDKKLEPFINEILRLSSISRNNDLVGFLGIFLNETNWGVNLLKNRNPLSSLASYEAFLIEAKKFVELDKSKTLSDFLKYINTIENYKIRISVPNREERQENISLMTAHKSKGLEFDYVFIKGVIDKNWGNLRDMNKFRLPLMSPSHIEDDRRLFYVALTRARKKAYLTYSLHSSEGTTFLPSQFIMELKKDMVKKETFDTKNNSLNTILGSKREDLLDKKYLRSIFLNESFSVTALNNYLECAWKYFFRNLIRVPELQNKHQMYGTAVHDALKEFCYSISNKKEFTKDDFLTSFERELEKKPMSLADFKESLLKGQKALSGYFETYRNVIKDNLLCEYKVSGISILVPDTEYEISITGKIDKIELASDNKNEAQIVHVVDYKTGKPKSRSDIEGNTKNSTGNYKRQLVFYKYLLDNDINRNGERLYDMRSGEIDFIEPDVNGKYKKEIFEITKTDSEEIRILTEKTLSEIYNLDFLSQEGCEEEDCKECKLSKLLFRS